MVLSGTTVGTVTTLTGHTAQTGDSFARLGAPAGVSVSADIAAIEAQTDDIGVAGSGLTALPAGTLTAAERNSVADALLVRQMTEAYAAKGVAPTVAQSFFGIQQFLMERSIVANTMTTKKLDGSTTAMTFTLNDDNNPTSITRDT